MCLEEQMGRYRIRSTRTVSRDRRSVRGGAQRQRSRGFLLIVGLFVITGLLTLSAAGLNRSMTELLVTNRHVTSQQALQAAEALLNEAIHEYRTGGESGTVDFQTQNAPGGEGWLPGGGAIYPPLTQYCPQAGVTCRMRLRDLTTMAAADTQAAFDAIQGPKGGVNVLDIDTQTPMLIAVGIVGGIQRRVAIVGSRKPPSFDYAFFGGDLMRVGSYGTGPVTIDSYDSTLGEYDADLGGGVRNKGYAGHVGTNDDNYGNRNIEPDVAGDPDPENVDLRVETTARIDGGLYGTEWSLLSYAAGAGCRTGSGPYGACSTVLPIPPRELPPIEVPADLAALPCPSAYTRSAGTEVISSDRCYTQMTLSGTAEVILANDVRIYLRGTGAGSNTLYITQEAKLVSRRKNELYGGPGRFWVQSTNGLVSAKALDGNPGTIPDPKDFIIRMEGNGSSYTYNASTNSWGSIGSSNGLEQKASFYGALYVQNGFLWIKGAENNPPGSGTYVWADATHYGAIVAGQYLNPATHSPNFLTFHHDVSLDDISINGSTKYFKTLSWRELAPGESP